MEERRWRASDSPNYNPNLKMPETVVTFIRRVPNKVRKAIRKKQK